MRRAVFSYVGGRTASRAPRANVGRLRVYGARAALTKALEEGAGNGWGGKSRRETPPHNFPRGYGGEFGMASIRGIGAISTSIFAPFRGGSFLLVLSEFFFFFRNFSEKPYPPQRREPPSHTILDFDMVGRKSQHSQTRRSSTCFQHHLQPIPRLGGMRCVALCIGLYIWPSFPYNGRVGPETDAARTFFGRFSPNP